MKVTRRYIVPYRLITDTLSDGGNYDWSDFFDKTLYMNVDNVKAYNLPSLASNITGIYDNGDPVPVYSFIISGGIAWVEFPNYTTGNHDYIPLVGAPGNGITVPAGTIHSVFNTYGIPTVEQKAAQQQQENTGPLDSLVNAIKGVGAVAFGLALLYFVTKGAKK